MRDVADYNCGGAKFVREISSKMQDSMGMTLNRKTRTRTFVICNPRLHLTHASPRRSQVLCPMIAAYIATHFGRFLDNPAHWGCREIGFYRWLFGAYVEVDVRSGKAKRGGEGDDGVQGISGCKLVFVSRARSGGRFCRGCRFSKTTFTPGWLL